jgi:cystathionine beta-lyase/cystathionine gamma-synthase
MTHGSVPHERKQELGITADLVRLSVGIEGIDDIIADLREALDATQQAAHREAGNVTDRELELV